jgi:hypothetical protein
MVVSVGDPSSSRPEPYFDPISLGSLIVSVRPEPPYPGAIKPGSF